MLNSTGSENASKQASAARPSPPAPVPEGDLRSTSEDVRGYHRTIMLRGALTFAMLVICHYGLLPIWSLWVANLVLYPQIYLRVHDIGHGTPRRGYGWAARFIPVSNPIWGGTRVFAVIHREHHKFLGTNKDPWLPYYMGSPARALFFNFIEPEYSCWQFIVREGFDRELARNFAFNILGLGIGLYALGGLYAVHVLSQRVVHALGIFFFNFYVHRATLSAAAPIGTWERADELAKALPLLRFIWGRDTIDGLIYHNRHHCLGQQHVPVQHYKHLRDTGGYTQFHHSWPISHIREL
jgi:hypothetical protein